MEAANYPWVRAGGKICHRIRDYKIAIALGLRCVACCYEYNDLYLTRVICESVAFNRGIAGYVSQHQNVKRAFIHFPQASLRKSILK